MPTVNKHSYAESVLDWRIMRQFYTIYNESVDLNRLKKNHEKAKAKEWPSLFLIDKGCG